MDTPRIYVACLAAYNNGLLHGEWLDATQGEDDIYKGIYDMLAASPIEGAEEWALHDYSGFGEARIDEYGSIENVVKLAKFIDDYEALDATLLGEYSIDDAQTLLEDSYYGA